MNKITTIIIFLTAMVFFQIESKAESKKDCSQYSTKTFAGLVDKMRCKKGLPPREKNVLKLTEWKSIKKRSNPTYIPGKPCDEYSTKTFVGLAAKMKCKKNQ